jgi:hypothetical protein
MQSKAILISESRRRLNGIAEDKIHALRKASVLQARHKTTSDLLARYTETGEITSSCFDKLQQALKQLDAQITYIETDYLAKD